MWGFDSSHPSHFSTAQTYVAPSSSGLGRRPLKAEVAGSNPVGATRNPRSAACFAGLNSFFGRARKNKERIVPRRIPRESQRKRSGAASAATFVEIILSRPIVVFLFDYSGLRFGAFSSAGYADACGFFVGAGTTWSARPRLSSTLSTLKNRGLPSSSKAR